MTQIRPNCGQCSHYDPLSSEQGVCTRFPPRSTVVLVPTQAQDILSAQRGMSLQPQDFTSWPVVQVDKGCGEFKKAIALLS